jgi:hypothetical protein
VSKVNDDQKTKKSQQMMYKNVQFYTISANKETRERTKPVAAAIQNEA